ncbi:PilW family protein [Luteimonas aquatica]|uniref:PilW family protein n=1 Tax=Luteimonas aquatica TaxID=450364 RepID=UPI001F57DE0D|nr:PilW family protein [Luteimonas aquatica]
MKPRRNQYGLSLIELMIALLIGTILMLGLLQVFSASRASYQLSEGLSRTQENGRFALDYLQRDIRMAGHFGCVNDQAHAQQNPNGLDTTFGAGAEEGLRFDISIRGYEATGTAPSATGVAVEESPGAGSTAYTPALPDDIEEATPNRIAGSDIIALRYLAPEGVPVAVIAGSAGEPSFSFDAERWDVLRSGVDDPGLFGVADCTGATVFEAGNDSDGAGGEIVVDADAPANDGDFSKVFTAGQAMLYRAESVVYYVGRKRIPDGSWRPALYRVRFQAAPGGEVEASDPQELVEGVENLQLLYGQDRELSASASPTGFVDRVGTAGAVNTSVPNAADAWRRVGLVQVGVLIASNDRTASEQATQRPPTSLGVGFALPDDGRYRTVYETTVALRNRLYGN